MKKIFITVLTAGFLLVMTGCADREIHANYKAYFRANTDSGIVHSLYIDGKYIGELPYLPESYSDKSIKDKGLLIQLQSGRYDVMVKDAEGVIISKGYVLLKKTTNSENISVSWNNKKCEVEIIRET